MIVANLKEHNDTYTQRPFFHLIWSTKNRKKWIDSEVQSDLYPYMGGIIRNYKGSLIKIGGMPDHVHLLISLRNLDKYFSLLRDVKAHSTLMTIFTRPQGFKRITISSYSFR